MSHSVFTVVAVIKPGCVASLKTDLARVQANPAANPLLPFGQIRNLHFASFVIFETPDLLAGLPEFKDPILVFESNIDGGSRKSRKQYLKQLLAVGPGLNQIFGHCVGYPEQEPGLDKKLRYLLGKIRKPQLYHIGTPYRTARGIQRDRALREKLDLKLETVMGKSLPVQLDTPAAGTGERWIWERLSQRKNWAAKGLIAGLLVRALWRHTLSFADVSARLRLSPILAPVHRLLRWLSSILAPVHHWLSVLYPHWPSLLVLLLFVDSLAFFAMADSRIVDPERLRTRQWLPLTIAAFALGIRVQMLWAGHRPLALLLVLLPLPVVIGLAALADIRHNRLERLDALGSAGDIPSPASVVKQLHRLTRQAGDRARLCRLQKQRLEYAGVGLITGLVVRLAYPHWHHWPSFLLLLLFAVCVGLVAMVDLGEDDADRLTPMQWTPWAIGALVVGIAARSIWDASGWWGVFLLSLACVITWAAASPSRCPSPRIWRLWNWKWWAVVWLGILGLMKLFDGKPTLGGHHGRLVAFVVSLFFLKALWLSTLAGWMPLKPLMPRWPPKIIGFVIIAPAAGFLLVRLLLVLGWSLPWIALAVFGSLLLLWSVPLPSPSVPKPPRNPRLPELRDQEDRGVQNHMAAMVVLQEGMLRKPLLKLFLWTLNGLFFRALLPDLYRGKLFGLPTVHFAQWSVLDSRRYLFLSNYDHSWTRYLDDFGIELTTGIQKIWGQGQDNPGTSNLDSFKDFARSTMVPHQVWYSAYHSLTLDQIWNNQMIRRGLGRTDGNDESAIALLRRFAAGPRIQNAFSK